MAFVHDPAPPLHVAPPVPVALPPICTDVELGQIALKAPPADAVGAVTGATEIVLEAETIEPQPICLVQEIVPEAVVVGVLVTEAALPVPEKLAGKVQASDPVPVAAVYV